MGVSGPGPCRNESFVCILVVFVERITLGVDEVDRILELCGFALSVRGDDLDQGIEIIGGWLILTPRLLSSLHDDKGLERQALCSDELKFLEKSSDNERGLR